MRCGTRSMIAFAVVTAILSLFDLMLMIVTALACCGVVVLGDAGVALVPLWFAAMLLTSVYAHVYC
ncbi:hypothetical protein [uncultured Bifidobacterium sp.]|uniref:hypothetical protein n=1 Tax=uncultured Bifidobacterium sp. TaxID=165187 RepID=UPI00259982B9|nr:hypothetical protein [uncultured Bifidobacterium sp.]